MRRGSAVAIFFALLFMLSSCGDNSVCDGNSPILSEGVSSVQNVRWTLVASIGAGVPVSLAHYRPFHFFIGDSVVYGDDGCNTYFGRFSLRNDSLVLDAISGTEMSCGNAPRFDYSYLRGEWRVMVSDSLLSIRNNNSALYFTSDFPEPPTNLPFLNYDMKLFSSNDTSFNLMEKDGLIPTLKFEADRTFELKWKIDTTDAIFPFNLIAGSFGIAGARSIAFYNTAEMFSTSNIPPYGAGDLYFQERILSSSEFNYSIGSVTLSGGPGTFYYTFVPK